MNDAWSFFSSQRWTALMAEDRAQRGPVDGEAPSRGSRSPDERADVGRA